MPWPKMISVRVRMLAPSTVIWMDEPSSAISSGFFGPRHSAAPPMTSMASMTTRRVISVCSCFEIAEITDGRWPSITAPATNMRAASLR